MLRWSCIGEVVHLHRVFYDTGPLELPLSRLLLSNPEEVGAVWGPPGLEMSHPCSAGPHWLCSSEERRHALRDNWWSLIDHNDCLPRKWKFITQSVGRNRRRLSISTLESSLLDSTVP